MKKVLGIGIILLIMLVGCSNVQIHDDVDEEVANDALQLMDVVTKNVDKGTLYEDASSKDRNIVDSYYDKYIGKFNTKKGIYDGVDDDILIISKATTVKFKKGITLETEKEDLKESESNLKEFISTGKGYDID